MDPYTLQTHAGPFSMEGFCTGGIAPSSTRVPMLDKVQPGPGHCMLHVRSTNQQLIPDLVMHCIAVYKPMQKSSP